MSSGSESVSTRTSSRLSTISFECLSGFGQNPSVSAAVEFPSNDDASRNTIR